MNEQTNDQNQPQTEPPPPPPPSVGSPPPLSHRLYRRPEGKIIAGVCSGLGAYWNVDPVALRVGFVLLAIFTGGLGVLAYLIAWLVMPMARPDQPVVPRPPGDRDNASTWIAIGAICIGAVILARGFFTIHGGVFWGLLLIGIGVLIWGREAGGRREPRPRPTPPPAAPPPPATIGGAAPTQPLDPPLTPEPPASAPTAPITPSQRLPEARAARDPSILGRLVVGAAALAIGAGLLLDNIGTINLTSKGMFAALLGIVGAGLLVGSLWGRARWLIFPGAFLALALFAASTVPFTKGGFGEIVWHPTSLRAMESRTFQHTAGQAVLDLTDLKFGTKERRVDVRLGFGELAVIVPEDVNVVAEAHVQGGETDLFGKRSDGWDVTHEETDEGKKNIGPLYIDARVTFGELHIRRGDSDDVDDILNSGRNRVRINIDGNGVNNNVNND